MKSKKFFTIIGFTIFFSISMNAQVTLPYYTGFDNASQLSGWTEYKKGATTFSHWGGSYDAFSAPNCIGHDFSPSTGITLTDNWFVSPQFSIPNGGKLDSIRYMFWGFSQPESIDTIAIYLLNGSADPSLAVSKTLLIDFRNADYITDITYRLRTNINLFASSGASYLAIRYRNSNCSSKWLSVCFDNIAISGNNVGIDDLNQNTNKGNFYPNPSKGRIYIDNKRNINAIEIYNLIGECIYTNSKFSLQNSNEIDLSIYKKGIYFAKIYIGTKSYTEKIVIQ